MVLQAQGVHAACWRGANRRRRSVRCSYEEESASSSVKRSVVVQSSLMSNASSPSEEDTRSKYAQARIGLPLISSPQPLSQLAHTRPPRLFPPSPDRPFRPAAATTRSPSSGDACRSSSQTLTTQASGALAPGSLPSEPSSLRRSTRSASAAGISSTATISTCSTTACRPGASTRPHSPWHASLPVPRVPPR